MGESNERLGLFNARNSRRNIEISPVSDDSNIVYNSRPGWTKWLIVAGISTTIGGSLPVGYNIGVVNAPADIIKTYVNESMHTNYDIYLTQSSLDILWSSIVSIFLVGGVTGSLSGSWLADLVGRKGAYAISTLLNVIAGVLFFICKYVNSFEILMVGRLIAGLGGGLITCIVPMYLTEMAPLHLRGAMGVLCALGVTFGVLVGQVMSLRELLGTEETWAECLSFFVLLVIICASVLPFFPESPKYLYVIKKQHHLALRELSKIRGMPASSLTDEILDLQVHEENNENTDAPWNLSRAIKDRSLLLPILLVCSMQAGQQFSGINAVFYYSVSIFKNAGLDEKSAQFANIGAGSVNTLMAVVAIWLMSHCNRRPLFIFSCLCASICLLILGLAIYFITAVSWMPYICIVACLSYVFFYQLGLGPIPYFVGSELFETGPRPSAMALGSMANWGGNFVIGMTFPTMQNALGAGVFVIFAVITLLLMLFIRRYFPETRGKDPSEISMLIRDGLSSRPLEAISLNTYVPNDNNVVNDKTP